VRRVLARAVERQWFPMFLWERFYPGGLDSSAVVAYARQHTKERLQCFSIDFGEQLAKEEGFERDFPYAERLPSI